MNNERLLFERHLDGKRRGFDFSVLLMMMEPFFIILEETLCFSIQE